MSADTTTVVAALSPPLSPTAAAFTPASPLSPCATEFLPGINAFERLLSLSLSPEALDFVPASIVSPDSPLSPLAPVYVPAEHTPAEETVLSSERLPLPTESFLTLLDRYRRNVVNDILHLERLEALPILEATVAHEDWDLWYDAVKASCGLWIDCYKSVKARLDAEVWLDEEEEEEEEEMEMEAPDFAFSEYQSGTFTFRA